jgi:hypothetical protein
MTWPHIDAYIREFEEFVCKAEYDTHHDETLEYFVEGLPRSVKEVVFLPPLPRGYQATKQKAIDATQAAQVLNQMSRNALLGRQTQGRQNPREAKPLPKRPRQPATQSTTPPRTVQLVQRPADHE